MMASVRTPNFGRDDPLAALDEYIAVSGRFRASDRLLHRRLRGLAALGPAALTLSGMQQPGRQ
jgi:hypothetical protein